MTKHKTIWFKRSFLPTYIGFVPSRKAWNKTMKELKVKDHHYPTANGWCSEFHGEDGKHLILIGASEIFDETYDPLGIIALLAHEITHVKQYIMDDIGEDKPSMEFEAYLTQSLLLSAVDAFEETRHKLVKKAKKHE